MQKAKKGKNTGKIGKIKQKAKNIAKEFGKHIIVAALVVATGGSVSGCGNSYDEKPKEKKEVICSTEIEELNQSRIKSMELDDNVEGREYFVQRIEKEVCTDGENEWVESEKHSFEPSLSASGDWLVDIEFEFMGEERSVSDIFIDENEKKVVLQLTDVESKQFLEKEETEAFITEEGQYNIEVIKLGETEIKAGVTNHETEESIIQILPVGNISFSMEGLYILLYDVGKVKGARGINTVAWVGCASESFYLWNGHNTEIEFNQEKFHVSTTIDADMKEDGRIIINGIEIKRIEIEN
ncbi:hypothetical protein KAW38_03195 [Candidatus Micrarchaeota archaeon]|nr:hypothetical protein [Candidatus Micrarchaeota archaeon]